LVHTTAIKLPDWMPHDAWVNYMRLRKEKRAKINSDAADLLICKLAAWRNEGQDVRIARRRITETQNFRCHDPRAYQSQPGSAFGFRR
jgi:hypothetical protein